MTLSLVQRCNGLMMTSGMRRVLLWCILVLSFVGVSWTWTCYYKQFSWKSSKQFTLQTMLDPSCPYAFSIFDMSELKGSVFDDTYELYDYTNCGFYNKHIIFRELRKHKCYTASYDDASILISSLGFQPLHAHPDNTANLCISPKPRYGIFESTFIKPWIEYIHSQYTGAKYLFFITFSYEFPLHTNATNALPFNVGRISVDSYHSYFRSHIDISLPPPTLKSFLNEALSFVNNKKYLMTFRGPWRTYNEPFIDPRYNKEPYFRRNHLREQVGTILNLNEDARADIIYTLYPKRAKQAKQDYDKLYSEELLQSTYCFQIGGDGLWSYRFMESISAGCIPLIIANGWVLPYSNVINWSRYVIILNEKIFYDDTIQNSQDLIQFIDSEAKPLLQDNYDNNVTLWHIAIINLYKKYFLNDALYTDTLVQSIFVNVDVSESTGSYPMNSSMSAFNMTEISPMGKVKAFPVRNWHKKYRPLRVWCCVLAMPDAYEMLVVQQTYGRYCDNLLFFVGDNEQNKLEHHPIPFPNATLNVIYLQLNCTGDGLPIDRWEKQVKMYQYLYTYHRNEFEWIIRLDTDAWFNPPNFKGYAQYLDPDQAWYFGVANAETWRIRNVVYVSGGLTVLSRESIRLLTRVFKTKEFWNRKSKRINEANFCHSTCSVRADDVVLAQCLRTVGVFPMNTLDEEFKGRFFCQKKRGVESWDRSDGRHRWYWLDRFEKTATKKDAIAEYVIGFHGYKDKDIQKSNRKREYLKLNQQFLYPSQLNWSHHPPPPQPVTFLFNTRFNDIDEYFNIRNPPKVQKIWRGVDNLWDYSN